MYLTKEMLIALLQDKEQFNIVNKTDHAEWFSGMKPARMFDFNMDVWTDNPGIVFETDRGMFAASPAGKVFRVDLNVEVGLTGQALQVCLGEREFVVERAQP